MPGSTGVTDDEGTWAVALNDAGSAAIRSAVSSAAIKLRYPITGGPAQLDGFDPAFCLRLSLRDTGPTARVVARLIALHVDNGAQTTLGTIDSDADPRVVAGTQYQTATTCSLIDPANSGTLQGFDYGSYAYYVEVTLTKNDSSGNPGVRVVGITGG